jgi:hypothetical protein
MFLENGVASISPLEAKCRTTGFWSTGSTIPESHDRLLMEVDSWTGSRSPYISHAPARGRRHAGVTVIWRATGIGLPRCWGNPKLSYPRRLDCRLVRSRGPVAELAEIVGKQHKVPLAARWGRHDLLFGRTSISHR